MWAFSAIFACSFYDNIGIFSLDPLVGCLGFMNSETWMFAYLVLGFFSSVCFSMGTILSTLFFSPLVVANVFLLEPVVAQIIGFVLGLDKMPGILTFFGISLAMIGVLFFYKGS